MKKCKITFQEEGLEQAIIVDCKLDEKGNLDFKLLFDPPVKEDTDLGSLAGQLAYRFCEFLSK